MTALVFVRCIGLPLVSSPNRSHLSNGLQCFILLPRAPFVVISRFSFCCAQEYLDVDFSVDIMDAGKGRDIAPDLGVPTTSDRSTRGC